MIKIKNIEIGSYKLFKDTTLNLENIEGVVSVQGINNDIKNFSANSVGKTTFVSALLHCLYGKNLTGDSLEKCTNIYTNDKPSVTVTFEIENIEYVVINDYAKNVLKVFKEGDLVEVPRKTDLFKTIEQILGISHFLMSNLIYISPTSSSLFSSAGNDSQSKFIQQLLNLEFIGDIYKKASADLKSYKGELGLAIKELTIKQGQVESLGTQLELVPEVEDIDYTTDINRISGEISQLEIVGASTKKVLDKLNKEKDTLAKRVIEDKAELKHLEAALKKEQDLIKGGSCPTCGQNTHELEIQTNTVKIKELKSSIEEITETGIAKKSEIKAIEQELLGIISETNTKNNELLRLKKDKEAHEKNKQSEQVRNKLVEQLAKAVEELTECQEKMQELEKKVYILDLISSCSSPKGFVKERISLFLQLYNIELQKLSKTILGGEYLVQITKTKSNHYELMVDDGEGSLTYSSLSSGFKARMDIILTLALNKAVEALTGISINILILDEIISSMDEKGVASVSKLLTKIQNTFKDKIIFIVSHNQHLQFTTNTLIVERDSGTSKFTWVE